MLFDDRLSMCHRSVLVSTLQIIAREADTRSWLQLDKRMDTDQN